jgi:Cu/Ag efflux pump CusA
MCIDTATRDIGGYVDRAAVASAVTLPRGTMLWTGRMVSVRAHRRLEILIPIVLFAIFVLLYMTFSPCQS